MPAHKTKKDLYTECTLHLKTLTEVHLNNIVVEKKDLRKLLPNTWLNDTIINYYMQLLKVHYQNLQKDKKVYMFSTFFFSKLCRDYETTLQNLQEANLTEYELIFMPIHQNSHWTLLVYDKKRVSIEYFDSLVKEIRQISCLNGSSSCSGSFL